MSNTFHRVGMVRILSLFFTGGLVIAMLLRQWRTPSVAKNLLISL